MIVDSLSREAINLKFDIDLELLERSQFELIIGFIPVLQYAPLLHVKQLVFVNEDNEVKILMTLTSPNCPVAESLPQEVEEKIRSIDEVKTAEVEITFDPPWTKDLMSEEAKLELGFL